MTYADRYALDLDGKPWCPTGYAQRYHVIGQCGCFEPDPLTVPEEDSRWHAEASQAPVQHASLLACIVLVLPVAVACLWLLGRARDVVRRVVGR